MKKAITIAPIPSNAALVKSLNSDVVQVVTAMIVTRWNCSFGVILNIKNATGSGSSQSDKTDFKAVDEIAISNNRSIG